MDDLIKFADIAENKMNDDDKINEIFFKKIGGDNE